MIKLDLDTIQLPFVQVLSNDCEIINEIQCHNMSAAQIRRNRILGEGKIAIIVMKTVLWEDSIPF